MPHFKSTILAALATAASVNAHGYVKNIVVNGVSYGGYISDQYPYSSSPPVVAGWTIDQKDLGFVAPDAYGSGDIICHRNATNAKGHIPVNAGDKISLGWTAWPSSHHGPVITYLANCGSSCETVDKSTLKFFKIDAVGLIDDTTVPGNWGTDVLEGNNNSWLVQIPSTIAAGNYVMRHEIIALHSSGSANGAQNYPFCINLKVSGSGRANPAGVAGTALYKSSDPGILVNIYTSIARYTIPGPTLVSGAVTGISQTSPAVTATRTAVTT